MASGRKPVWLSEDAHLLIKEYAKLTKTSMTETASQLVLQHVESLEGGTGVDGASAPAADAAPEKEAAPAPAAKPKKAESKASAPKPKPKKRASRSAKDRDEHIGGIWIV